MKNTFTLVWQSLNSPAKSLAISFGAIVLSISMLLGIRLVFPAADLSAEEVVILTAVNGFISFLLKESLLQGDK